jgi:hypothetical protein
MGWRAVPALLVVSGLVLGACGGDGGSQDNEAKASLACPTRPALELPGDLSSLTLEQVYEHMIEAMTCPGHVLHVTMTVEEAGVTFPEYGEVTSTAAGGNHRWVDVLGDRARWETESSESEDVTVVLGDTQYRLLRLREDVSYGRRPAGPLGCEGSVGPLFRLLDVFGGCGGPPEQLTTRFEPEAAYEDRSVPAIVAEGESGTWVISHWYYLDQDSLLPVLVAKDHGEPAQDGKPSAGTHVIERLDYEFVPSDSLPEDFFDPTSIEPDPQQELLGADLGSPVYWLGADFVGGEGLAALSLDDVDASVISGVPRVDLYYTLASDRFGPWLLLLGEYPRVDWDALLAESTGDYFWERPCTQLSELDLGDRRAVVYGAYLRVGPAKEECPEGRPNRWGTYVYIGDTVVHIYAFDYLDDGKFVPNPYGSVDGIETIVKALVPYE